MSKAVKLFTGSTMDYTATTMAAVRTDGAVFMRVKGRTRYGYAWSKWRSASAVPASMSEMTPNSARVTDGAYFTDGMPNVRLP